MLGPLVKVLIACLQRREDRCLGIQFPTMMTRIAHGRQITLKSHELSFVAGAIWITLSRLSKLSLGRSAASPVQDGKAMQRGKIS